MTTQTVETSVQASEEQLNNAPVVQAKHYLRELGQHYQLDPKKLWDIVARTCFPSDAKVTVEAVAMLLLTARKYDLDPFVGEIQAFQKDGRLVPIIPSWGHLKMALRQPRCLGFISEEIYQGEDGKRKYANTVGITANDKFIGSRAKALLTDREPDNTDWHYAWLDEWFIGTNPNWKNRPKHMCTLRAKKIAAKEEFGFGMLDEDDTEVIVHQNQKIEEVEWEDDDNGGSRSDQLAETLRKKNGKEAASEPHGEEQQEKPTPEPLDEAMSTEGPPDEAEPPEEREPLVEPESPEETQQKPPELKTRDGLLRRLSELSEEKTPVVSQKDQQMIQKIGALCHKWGDDLLRDAIKKVESMRPLAGRRQSKMNVG